MVMNYGVVLRVLHRQGLAAVQGAVQPALQHGARLHAAGHGDRHAQQRHAVLLRRHGPAGRAVRHLQSGDREVALLLGAAHRPVHVQLRLHRQPHHRQRRRLLHDRRPGWKGETPKGIGKVFRCETDFSIALIRTQLFNPADIDNVKKIQAGYQAHAALAVPEAARAAGRAGDRSGRRSTSSWPRPTRSRT